MAWGTGVSWGGGSGNGGGGGLSPRATGWASYRDTYYTAQAPLSLVPGQRTLIPNNALAKNESQIPEDLANWYDPATGKVVGSLGSDIIITQRGTLVPTDPSTTNILVEVDIGTDGNPIILDSKTIVFAWGEGIPSALSYVFSGYCLANFVTNGARIYITADGPCDLYAISLLVKRTHKGV